MASDLLQTFLLNWLYTSSYTNMLGLIEQKNKSVWNFVHFQQMSFFAVIQARVLLR